MFILEYLDSWHWILKWGLACHLIWIAIIVKVIGGIYDVNIMAYKNIPKEI